MINSVFRFAWCNVQSLAQFDPRRVGKARLPCCVEAYLEKHSRIVHSLREMFEHEGVPDLLVLGEITASAASALMKDVLPDYKVFTLDTSPDSSGFEIACLYRDSTEFAATGSYVPPGLTENARAIGMIDFSRNGHHVRIAACHWPARFNDKNVQDQEWIARHLNQELYKFTAVRLSCTDFFITT